jgi:hypothetical protein
MSQGRPHKILVEFEDGSTCEALFESLPETLQLDLMRQPFASKPSPEPEKEKFLILEWDDGWKEVIRVDNTCTEINRYCVISRVEHVGRLSIHKQNDYPELIEIIRKPLNLNRITFADTFEVNLQKSDREGEKTDHFFALTKDEKARPNMMDTFKATVEQEGVDLRAMKAMLPDRPPEPYEKIWKALGIKAGVRQQDLEDFIAFLVKTGS